MKPATCNQTHNNLGCVSQVLAKEGTVTPAANFHANGDAAVLDKAIKTKGEFKNAHREALERV